MGRLVFERPDLSLADRQACGGSLAVLVGQAPSKHGDPKTPLMGRSGRRLANLAEVDYPGAFAETFDRVNLLEEWPGPSKGKGDAFPREAAADAAFDLEPELRGRVAVALGKDVASSFGLRSSWYSWRVVWRMRGRWRSLEWAPVGGPDPYVGLEEEGVRRGIFLLACAPHPSSISHYWNDRSAIAVDEGFWRSLLGSLRSHYATGSRGHAKEHQGR